MGLLSPWMLLGLAAIAVPVLVHLAEREERSGRAFPSLMFLRRVPLRERRRKHLRDLPLLLLRALAVAAAVLAFAGPYLTAVEVAPTADGSVDRVILLDRSYSMRIGERWARAEAAVEDEAGKAGGRARVALVEFDHAARVLQPLAADPAAVRGALAGLGPGHGGSDLSAGLAAAEHLLADSEAASREVVLVTDLQRRSVESLPRLADGIALRLVPVVESGDAPPANLALMEARAVSPPAEGGPGRLTVRVRASGGAPTPPRRMTLEVEGQVVAEATVAVAPGEDVVVDLPLVPASDRSLVARLRLEPDDLDADDEWYLVVAPDRALRVALVLPDVPRRDAGFFVEQALALAHTPAVALRRIPVGGVDGAALADVDVVILDDVPLTDAAAGAVAAHVADGGGLLVVAAENAPGGWPTPLDARLPAVGAPVPTGGGDAAVGLVARLDADHPVLAPLASVGARALGDARVWRHRSVSATAADRVLAWLDDESPLLLARDAGGRVLLFTTTLDPRWSSLASASGFAPLMIEAVRHLGGRAAALEPVLAGRGVDLAARAAALPEGAALARFLEGGGGLVVESPSARQLRLAPGRAVAVLDEPGIHEIHRDDGTGAAVPLAVNADRAESDLTALDPEAFLAAVTRPVAPTGKAGGRVEDARADAPRAWWHLLALAALALVAESLLAGWIARRPRRSAAGESGGRLAT
ncbi:MAG: BatA domain-containing protein [Ectothiorhodospiraceae bacterium]|nr:BatA domain-containing protein [Ectothiorhodospiraceae bacterium]